MSGGCLEGIDRAYVGGLEGVWGVSQVGLELISLKEQQQQLMDFENRVIVKIYKS